MMEEYLLLHHKTDMLQILQDTDYKKHYPINMNFVELFEYDTNLGNNILKNSDVALKELDEWITEAQNIFIQQEEDSSLTAKPSLHARVYGLPACPQRHGNIFQKNMFLQITGTVVRVTATKILEYRRLYICTKCKKGTMVDAVYEEKYIIIPPKKCLNYEGCPGKKFTNCGDLNADNCKEYQEVKIQEQASKLGIGAMPSSIWVTLEDDLVDSCKPGDDVTICGIIKGRRGSVLPRKRVEVQLVLKANHIQINNGQASPSLILPDVKEQFFTFWEKYKHKPLEGRDLILKSFCPELYGMYIVKLAVAVVLSGGTHSARGNEIEIQVRSEPHILLVGDPGTGKSQLLRYAAKIIPRSVLTTGVGTTSAGLTVAAIREDGQWQLEGGALVLADGGICCIDKLNSMKPHDRDSIHEAMEQQTISVAKANMVCKLRTRCSILATTNPKGRHLDPAQPLHLYLALPSPLLSQFDVVLMLSDTYDNEWDNLVADYILNGIDTAKTDSSFWNLETLQQYFTIIRSLNPALTPSTNKILSTYYQAQRQATFWNKARPTVRLLHSLVRLSQAHARLMFHKEVHVMDALFAVVLIENSMDGECSVLSLGRVNVQAPFSAAPMEVYAQLAVSVLEKLGLEEILKNERLSFTNEYEYNSSISNSGNVQSTPFINNDVKLKKGIEDDCDSLSDKQILKEKSAIKGKKRNRLKSAQQKQTKIPKNDSSDFDDFQTLNLICSTNNDFDMQILNFTGDYNSDAESCSQLLSQCQDNGIFDFSAESVENVTAIVSQTTKLKQEIQENVTFKHRQQPHLPLDKKMNEEENGENDRSSLTNSLIIADKNKDSLSNKMEQFHKMFAFKPRDYSRSDHSKEHELLKEIDLERKDDISDRE